MDIRAIVQRNAWMRTQVAYAFMQACRVVPEDRRNPVEEDREDPDLRWCRSQRYGVQL